MICYTEMQIIVLTSCNICFIILHVYYIRGGDGMKIPKGLRVCYSIAADFAARFKADMLGAYAASAAFFIFVSLFPCFLLAVSILDLCGIAGWDVLYEFLAGAPRHVIDLLTSLMNEAENSGNMRIISIATLATLWAASRGVFCADGGARQNIQHTRRDTSVHRKQIACDPLHRCIYIDDDNHHRSPYLRRKDNGISE